MFDPKPIQIDTGRIKGLSRQFFLHLKKKKILLIALSVLAFGFAVVWINIRKPHYTAVSTFVLEEKSSGGGGIAGLASQFGIDLGSLSAGANGFFSGENIDDILTSSTILEKVLLSPVDMSSPNSTTLGDIYIDASGMRRSMAWKDILNGFSFQEKTNNKAKTRLRDSILYVIMDKVIQKDLSVERSNKKGTIFQVQMRSSDPLFARTFTERLVDFTSSMYVDIKTRNITANIKKLEARADSLRGSFQSKSYRSYQTQVLDANEAFTFIKAAGEVSQRDKSVAFELYAEVTKNLEVSRMMLINQTPVIQVLDRPRETLSDNNLAGWKVIMLFVVTGLFVGVIFALFSFKPDM